MGKTPKSISRPAGPFPATWTIAQMGLQEGDIVSCVIQRIKVTEARVTVSSGTYYLLQNQNSGNRPGHGNMYGYKYSWNIGNIESRPSNKDVTNILIVTPAAKASTSTPSVPIYNSVVIGSTVYTVDQIGTATVQSIEDMLVKLEDQRAKTNEQIKSNRLKLKHHAKIVTQYGLFRK